MFTRKDYMARKCSHHDYYLQFGSSATRVYVGHAMHKIRASTDEHLNDIPLKFWDNAPVNTRLLSEANASGGYSLSDVVCTAKAVARDMLEAEAQA